MGTAIIKGAVATLSVPKEVQPTSIKHLKELLLHEYLVQFSEPSNNPVDPQSKESNETISISSTSIAD